MTCHVCKEMNKTGNDAIDHSFDTFQRFYARYWIGGEDEISRHEYRYQELHHSDHTRLLELLPGSDHEQITCNLAEASIDDPPRYSALSYTWGTTPRTKTVLINGQSFLVTDNLWAALWHLRLPDRKRIIWIDAICIDQTNIEERNRVVLRMKDIYERAEEVIAWLGPEGNNGMLALSCIERVFDHYCRLFDRLGSEEATFQHMVVHRSWTGEREKGALTTFARKRFELMVSQKGKKFPLLDVLDTFRNHSAGDPHDKVYSALGFANNMKLPVEVDYRKGFSEMLRDVAVSCLHESSHNLRFLGHAGLLGTDHIPATWIPDWLHSNALTPFPKVSYHPGSDDAETLFDACAMNHRIWKEAEYAGLQPSVEEQALKVQGILVDYVRTASVVAGFPNNLDSIETLWYMPNMHKPYTPTGETLEEAYLRTLVADLKMKHGVVVGRGGSMYWRNRSDSPPPHDHPDIQHMLQQICMGRRFITTLEHRYIGLAPFWAEPGDAVFMLKGGEMLYLARPTLAGTYHFVGEAYVHGMMDGQVIQHFASGQGTMQTVEFAPVLNAVPDNTKPTPTIPGKPVDVKFTERGYGITGVEYSNPYEHMHPYVHSDIGPQMDAVILQAVEDATMACSQAGMPLTDVIGKIYVEQLWAKAVEEQLLSNDEAPTGSSSSFKLAGREFARRSYILAAIALEKERIRMAFMGEFQNVAPYKGGVHVLDCDIIEDNEKWNDSRSKEHQLAEDERIAQTLQAEEFASADTVGHPSVLGPGWNLVSDKSSAQNRFPLLNRCTGPPVRLMISDTLTPSTHAYEFRSDEDKRQFMEDIKQYTYNRGNETLLKRPLLFGRWATDPRKRPKVKVQSYGRPPDIWWEDEEGNVVEGPDINTSSAEDKITQDDATWNETVRRIRFGDWEGEGEADLPSEFQLLD
ncbi:hypothetical protein DL765_005797 [Monosporascus sp. GIB2]|nr:hypothetical protein DL765_005797 [Monosporascus sp. GIB2]